MVNIKWLIIIVLWGIIRAVFIVRMRRMTTPHAVFGGLVKRPNGGHISSQIYGEIYVDCRISVGENCSSPFL